jgi:hypothetical protein
MLRMITRSKHIVLDTDYHLSKAVVKVKIINGFSANNLKQNLNVEENHWVPDPGNNTLYFMSGCSVPRFKLKDRFKVTNKITKADTLFISDSVINDNPYITVHKKMYDMYSFFTHYLNNGFQDILQRMDNFYLELINSFEKDSDNELKNYYENQHVLFKSLMKNQNTFYLSENLVAVAYNTNFGTSSYRVEFWNVVNPWSVRYNAKMYPKIENQLFEVSKDSDLLNYTGKVYLQHEMLRHINGDDFIIDFNKYKEFVTMANAGEENLILCMELMANANFEKSFIYLLFLLSQYYQEIAYLKEKDHVNFKSLINFVYLHEPKNLHLGLTDGLELLKKHKKHTPANISMWNELKTLGYITEEIL